MVNGRACFQDAEALYLCPCGKKMTVGVRRKNEVKPLEPAGEPLNDFAKRVNFALLT
jgi:hypothetical protein